MSTTQNDAESLRAEIVRISAELDRSLDAYRAGTDADAWTRRARLVRLEAALSLADRPTASTPRAGRLDWLKPLGDFLLKATPIALSALALYVTSVVNERVKTAQETRRIEIAEGELDLATVLAIEDKLTALRAPDLGADQAETLALQIAAFGPRALLPLVTALDLDAEVEEKRADALRHALRMMALVDYQRTRLCDILLQALAAGTKGDFFQKDGKAMMTELARDISCTSGAASETAVPGG